MPVQPLTAGHGRQGTKPGRGPTTNFNMGLFETMATGPLAQPGLRPVKPGYLHGTPPVGWLVWTVPAAGTPDPGASRRRQGIPLPASDGICHGLAQANRAFLRAGNTDDGLRPKSMKQCLPRKELHTCVLRTYYHGGGRECWKHCTTSQQRLLKTQPGCPPPSIYNFRSDESAAGAGTVRFGSLPAAGGGCAAQTAGPTVLSETAVPGEHDWRHRVCRKARG